MSWTMVRLSAFLRPLNLTGKKMFRRYIKLKNLLLLAVIALTAGFFLLLSTQGRTGAKWNMWSLVLGDGHLRAASQQDIDLISKNLKVNLQVDNFASGQKMGVQSSYLLEITLSNVGTEPIPASAWEIYFDLFRLAEHTSYPYPYGFYTSKCGFKLFHVNGYLFKLEPVKRLFTEIQSMKHCTFELQVHGFQITRTDSLPNWFVAGNDVVPKVIESTKGEELQFVGEFNQERQYKRRYDDKISTPFSPAHRYELNLATEDVVRPKVSVIPTPLSVEGSTGKSVKFNHNTWVIIDNADFKTEVQYLAAMMKMKVVSSKGAKRPAILIEKKSVKTTTSRGEMKDPEGYLLKIDKDLVTINANQHQGAFYAIQTLLSLITQPGQSGSTTLPLVTIKDAPRFPHRGLHVDLARNFVSKKELLKLMDIMAMYKMNKLHLHLTDDEGWRLEIPGIPELTTIGSQRCYNPGEEQCLLPMLGSGPTADTSGSGYLSTKDYQELLHHAVSRHIDVIPEIDMPGHSRAAIKSIHSKTQRELRRKMNARIYSIIDDKDKSVYKSGQNFKDNAMNPCLDSTYEFTRKIITEIKNLHADIQPLKFYHFGGDEVASKAWSKSPACDAFMKKHPDLKTEYDLMKYFVHNLTHFCAETGISVGAWEDGLLNTENDIQLPFPRDHFKNKELYTYVWKRAVEPRSPHRSRLFANLGYKVILAYGSFLYFDHPYEPDPEERGLYWATRYISTHDVWSCGPDKMMEDINLDCPKSVKDKTDCTELKHPENIQGLQAELWTELVRNNDQVEYMLFPRLLALAERAWHKGPWEGNSSPDRKKLEESDWITFTNTVGKHELKRLDSLGINYRVPPPGTVVEKGQLKSNVEFPGLETQYFSEDQSSWVTFTTIPVIPGKNYRIRTRSTDGKRFSREIKVST